MSYPQNHKVIDISHFQPTPDFSMVKGASVVGVIHKFSEGATVRDNEYSARRVTAKGAGLLWGRYQFGHPGNIAAQVANFLDGWQLDELLALDWENTTDGTMSVAEVIEFHDRVLAATGQRIAIYSSNAAKEALSGPDPVLSKCRLWLAQYAAAPVCPPGWSKPWLWQWTAHGSVAGIVGNVDLDSFDGTDDELRASWAGISEPPETDTITVRVPAEPPETDTITVTISVPRGAKVKITTTGEVDVATP